MNPNYLFCDERIKIIDGFTDDDGKYLSLGWHREKVELIGKFEDIFGDYLDSMSGFVLIDVYGAEWILSPAYDLGSTEEQLRESNMSKLNNIYPDQLP